MFTLPCEPLACSSCLKDLSCTVSPPCDAYRNHSHRAGQAFSHSVNSGLSPHYSCIHSHPSSPSAGQNVNANPRPTPQDLAGFWDLLQLSIEDISLKFDELYHLKSNDWQPAPFAAAQSPPDRKVLPTPAAQCPGWGRKAAETGLSPPTTTAILPSSPAFIYLPSRPASSLRGDRRRASLSTTKGPERPLLGMHGALHLKEGCHGVCFFLFFFNWEAPL